MPHTRKDLEQAIEEGGTVLVGGVHIYSKDQLPTEGELKKLHVAAPAPASDFAQQGVGGTEADYAVSRLEHENAVTANPNRTASKNAPNDGREGAGLHPAQRAPDDAPKQVHQQQGRK